MEIFAFVAAIMVVTATASLVNARLFKLPETIGLMATGLVASVIVFLVGVAYPPLLQSVCMAIEDFDFSEVVLGILLGFLIFAGAFSSDAEGMSRERWPILLFSTVGILISTFVVSGMTFGVLSLLGIPIPFIHCLLFGALISPTDPIAVLAILKTTAVPRSLQADIAGESLLNDGVAVVVFLTIYGLAGGEAEGVVAATGALDVVLLFAREVIGGVVLGLVASFVSSKAIAWADNKSSMVLISVATVMGGYALAERLHVSGPLAMVVVGLYLGRTVQGKSVDDEEREHLSIFWESLDHLLNAVLFTLVGFVLLGFSFQDFQPLFILAGLLSIPVVLLARALSLVVTVPLTGLRLCQNAPSSMALLTWGGLRGGISVALALSLEPELSKDLILHLTYIVVVFAILVQGLTIGKLVQKLNITT